MNTSPLASATAATVSNPSTNQTGRKSSLTQEDFLNLLMTQMQYQDPLNPMDNSQMASQMAQLGMVDGINQISQSIEAMRGSQASMANLQLAGLIGKRVEATGNSLTVNEGKVSEGCYQLGRSGKVTIAIYDGSGNLVRTIDDGSKDSSKQRIAWDGRNQRGEKVPDGTYVFAVKGVDGKGQSIPASTSVMGAVSGISFENGVTYINIGSGKITVSDILNIVS